MTVSPELAPNLRASIVDVDDASVMTAPAYAIDANILMYSTYDRYDQQRMLGERVPRDDRVDAYLRYETRVRAAGGRLCVAPCGVFEFLRTVELAELRILWARLDAQAAEGDFSAFDPKQVRRMAGPMYREMQERIITYLASISKRFVMLEVHGSLTDLIGRFQATWLGPLVDSGDGQFVADARACGIASLISDDQDLATVEGVTLYTSNRTVIDTARSVARLVSRRKG